MPIERPRIVVVEDNPDNRLLLHALLDEHFELIEFENGPEALEGLGAARPQILLLDISLPEMDGVEVLRRLRKDPAWNRLPVIALTAHAMRGDREKYVEAGFSDYLTKPIVDEAVLVGAIRRLLPVTPGAP